MERLVEPFYLSFPELLADEQFTEARCDPDDLREYEGIKCQQQSVRIGYPVTGAKPKRNVASLIVVLDDEFQIEARDLSLKSRSHEGAIDDHGIESLPYSLQGWCPNV